MEKENNLYERFLLERDEIMKHKWIESEKEGYDIGFDRALLDWMYNHRKGWLIDNCFFRYISSELVS